MHLTVKFGFGRRRKSTSSFIIRFQSDKTTVMWFAGAWEEFASCRSHPGLFSGLNIQRSAGHKRDKTF